MIGFIMRVAIVSLKAFFAKDSRATFLSSSIVHYPYSQLCVYASGLEYTGYTHLHTHWLKVTRVVIGGPLCTLCPSLLAF